MAKEIIYLTAEGYKKLKEELDHLRSVERPAISAAIAEARDKGDLSENAEYDAAREAQGLLEMRIAKLEDTLANARVIDETKIDKSKVQILSKVTLLNHNTRKEMTYTIVAEHEANLREGARLPQRAVGQTYNLLTFRYFCRGRLSRPFFCYTFVSDEDAPQIQTMLCGFLAVGPARGLCGTEGAYL